MLEVCLGKRSVLGEVVEAIWMAVTDANFVFSSSGLSLKAVDPNGSLMMEILLRSDAFDHYRCDTDTTFTLRIDFSEMLGILHAEPPEYYILPEAFDYIITVKADDHNTKAVDVIFQSPMQDKEIFRCSMDLFPVKKRTLLKISEEADYHAIVKMPSSHFSTICTDLASHGLGGIVVTITVTENGVEFSTTGDDDIGTSTILRTRKAEEATVIKMSEPVRVFFGLVCLDTVTKATPLSNTVTISLSNQLPALLEYKYKIAETEMGHVRYYLEPNLQRGW